MRLHSVGDRAVVSDTQLLDEGIKARAAQRPLQGRVEGMPQPLRQLGMRD